MRNTIKWICIASLPLQFLFKQGLVKHPEWVEKWYSLGFYPFISHLYRSLYGWLPFSIGDVMYLFLIVYALYWLYKNRIAIRFNIWQSLTNLVAIFAVLHLTFYMSWGLNYFRIPLAQTLELQENFITSELIFVTETLALESNSMQRKLTGDSISPVYIPYSTAEIYAKTTEAYQQLELENTNFSYHKPSLKSSLISRGLSYMGYGGYLNPFTGEAQVNRLLPTYRLPVVSAHEIGHQLGYSAENETNFIGFLATRANPDPYFKYSAATFALNYCLLELNRRDSLTRKKITQKLNPGVRANFAESNTFWKHYKNPLEPLFKAVFNRYLEANKQKDGIASYNRIVGLLVAQYRKDNLIATSGKN